MNVIEIRHQFLIPSSVFKKAWNSPFSEMNELYLVLVDIKKRSDIEVPNSV